jgi:hypothetical protein
MEIRLVDVENCGGAIVTVTGEMLASRVVEVRILPYPGSPPDESGRLGTTAPSEDHRPVDDQ